MEVRKIGIKALKDALGPVGMVRFFQQYESGHGDYTEEKYQQPDLSVGEIDAMLRLPAIVPDTKRHPPTCSEGLPVQTGRCR